MELGVGAVDIGLCSFTRYMGCTGRNWVYSMILLIVVTASLSRHSEAVATYDYEDAYEEDYGGESLGVEPSFDVPLVNVTVTEGQTALLPCHIRHLGNYRVTWTDKNINVITYEDRRIIDDSRFSIVRSQTQDWNLQIRDVKWSDQGNYHCTINTETIRSKTVVLHVKVPPKILDDLTNDDQNVEEGATFRLTCSATGVPTPEVTWYRHSSSSARLAATESKQCEAHALGPGIGMTGEVLVIENVSRYCDDIYECTASNGVAPDVSRKIKVNVHFPPEVTIRTKLLKQYKDKDTILECTMTASPLAVNVWEKGGQRIVASTKYRIEAYDDPDTKSITLNLIIFSLTEEDFGEYRCLAMNALGQDEGTVLLQEIKDNEPAKPLPSVPTIVFGHKSTTERERLEKYMHHTTTTREYNAIVPEQSRSDAKSIRGSACLQRTHAVSLLVTCVLSVYYTSALLLQYM